jgi:hypothetical protein
MFSLPSGREGTRLLFPSALDRPPWRPDIWLGGRAGRKPTLLFTIARSSFRFSAPRPAFDVLFQLPPRSGKRTLVQPYPYRFATKWVAYGGIINVFLFLCKELFPPKIVDHIMFLGYYRVVGRPRYGSPQRRGQEHSLLSRSLRAFLFVIGCQREGTVNEESENIIAILQRLEKIEDLLQRIDRENRNEEARQAAFDVRWDQLLKEHIKIQKHVKENWERLNLLEQEPTRKKAKMWDTFTGRAIMLIATAIGTAIITQMPAILKILLGVK